MHTNKKPIDIYAVVTNRIIEHLEKGVVPWQQPWHNAGTPQNLVTGKQYRGINLLLLGSLGYSQNSFLTFKQAKELGGSVKKGEKSELVVFWNWVEKKNEKTQEVEKIPFLRYYNVFNISQCEGIPKEKLPPVVERENNPIQSCEEIINKMPKRPEIRHKEHQAYYNVEKDYVNMPEISSFVDSQSYYGTLFHELVHSSGHVSRLNRKELMEETSFSSEIYSIEELTAEIGASYLKAQAGIPLDTLGDSAAYIQHWLKQLKNDKKLIVYASAHAQRAADFIMDVRTIEKDVEVSEGREVVAQRENELREIRKEKAKILDR